MIIIVLFSVSFLSIFIPGCSLVTQEKTSLYGLIIGINDYQQLKEKYDLSGAVPDALGMYSALLEHGWGEDKITLLTDSSATKEAILGNIESIFYQAKEDDYVLIYYSGHGTFVADTDGDEQDGVDEAIVPWDYKYEDISTLILDDELTEIFSTSRTTKGAVIFDSCNSGGFINRSVYAKSFKEKTITFKELQLSGSNGDLDQFNFPVLTASSQNEYAYEDPEYLGHGVFTYFLLEGFKDLSADRDNDGLLTIRELFNYAENLTIKYTAYTQNPKLLYKLDFVDILIAR